MSSNNGRNSPDGLIVPAILVPDGEPVPHEWLAQHPDVIRVRATLVPRQLPSAQTEVPPQPDPPQPDASRSKGDPYPGSDDDPAERRSLSRAASPSPGSAGPELDSPVAAYLRFREALAGKGHARAASELAPRIPDPNTPDQGEESGDVAGQDGSDREPT